MISHPFKADNLIATYMQQLGRARWAGRIIGGMHTLCSILAFCNLTWATVILFGAFVDNLVSADYYIVFTLLLLEASRLASATFFTQLLPRFPYPGHRAFQELKNTQTEQSNRLSTLFRLLSPVLQVVLIAPSFVCSIIPYTHIRYPPDIQNLQTSLRIFYILVILNSAISTLIVLSSTMAWVYFEHLSEKSVLKYYDEVLHNTLMEGAIKADGFNFFHFAFRLLGSDYASYKPWEKVVKEHKALLRYLYAHKQGADYLQACLDSEDAAVRQAAANTVGAWADGVPKLQLPVELRTKLADVVGTGEVGWAAVNSFGTLARNNPVCNKDSHRQQAACDRQNCGAC